MKQLLVIEFIKSLKTVKSFMSESFYLCKFSVNKWYTCLWFGFVCFHSAVYGIIFKAKLHNFRHTLLCFHAMICNSVLQNRLDSEIKSPSTGSGIDFELRTDFESNRDPKSQNRIKS